MYFTYCFAEQNSFHELQLRSTSVFVHIIARSVTSWENYLFNILKLFQSFSCTLYISGVAVIHFCCSHLEIIWPFCIVHSLEAFSSFCTYLQINYSDFKLEYSIGNCVPAIYVWEQVVISEAPTIQPCLIKWVLVNPYVFIDQFQNPTLSMRAFERALWIS